MKLTRRELASALAPAVAMAQAVTSPPQALSDNDAARARMKSNSETLAKQPVPMDTEPAFQFKA
jgi:hypothetical protein